jgi:hypothetical protein
MSDTKPPNPKPRAAMDPEIAAMSRIDRILAELPEPAVMRVMTWLNTKHLQAPRKIHDEQAS